MSKLWVITSLSKIPVPAKQAVLEDLNANLSLMYCSPDYTLLTLISNLQIRKTKIIINLKEASPQS